jgi:serine/threonine protein kinase
MPINSVFAGRYKFLHHINTHAGIESWKAEDIITNDLFLLKICSADSETYVHSQLLREYLLFSKIRHQNILTPFFYDDSKGQPYLLYPFADGNVVKQLIGNKFFFEEIHALKLALSLAEAIKTFHDHKIIHRNIHPGNIYFLNNQYLLGSFKRQSELTKNQDSSDYLSPEVKNSLSDYSDKSDIYSFGVLIYEASNGRLPENSSIERNEFRFNSDFNNNFKNIIDNCLVHKPMMRPSADEIIKVIESVMFEITKPNEFSKKIIQSISSTDNEIEKTSPISDNLLTPVSAEIVNNHEQTTSPYKSERKKINYLLTGFSFLILSGILTFKTIDFNSNQDKFPQKSESNKISDVAIENIYIELPSKQLNISSFEPDTLENTINFSENKTENIKSNLNATEQLEAFKDSESGKYGFKNLRDNIVMILPVFEDVFEFNEGIAAVKLKGLWGYIDEKGDWIIKPQFTKANIFSNGKAEVMMNGQVFYINKSGRCIYGCSDVSQFE